MDSFKNTKDMIERYPFIRIDGETDRTVLDLMPQGWRKNFGVKMCEEIRSALLREGGELALNLYHVRDVREKYGFLQWCDNSRYESLDSIIVKYEEYSRHVCICCGEYNININGMPQLPLCGSCSAKYKETERV